VYYHIPHAKDFNYSYCFFSQTQTPAYQHDTNKVFLPIEYGKEETK